jgi:hypothetical protein
MAIDAKNITMHITTRYLYSTFKTKNTKMEIMIPISDVKNKMRITLNLYATSTKIPDSSATHYILASIPKSRIPV